MNETVLQRAGGRKFLATLAVVASASVLVWFSKIDAGVYSAVIIAVVGGFLTSNVVQKAVAAKGQP